MRMIKLDEVLNLLLQEFHISMYLAQAASQGTQPLQAQELAMAKLNILHEHVQPAIDAVWPCPC